jgi:uncharacterized membrane protein
MGLAWNQLYRLKSYLRSALWIIPLVALLLVQIVGELAHLIDARRAWTVRIFGVTGAQALYNAIITLTLSFIVFTFSSLLVAIQIAGGRRCRRRSMIRQLRCWLSISFTGFCEVREGGIYAPTRSSIKRGTFA